MKYVARVTKVLRTGIHKIGDIQDGELRPVADLPLPDRLEIELEGGPGDPCMIYRYTDDGEFCGDTWHEKLEDALAQAEFEYGLSQRDFRIVDE